MIDDAGQIVGVTRGTVVDTQESVFVESMEIFKLAAAIARSTNED